MGWFTISWREDINEYGLSVAALSLSLSPNIRMQPVGVQRLAMRVLFICSQNRLRSPTAEQIFASWEGIEVASAGLADEAENRVTPELLGWAQLIFVMERAHRSELTKKFRAYLRDQRIVCLDIPDQYHYMDPALVALLKAKVPRHLPRS